LSDRLLDNSCCSTTNRWIALQQRPGTVIGLELKEFIRQRTIEEVKTHQSRRPAMSQIDDSMLRLAQRAACKPRKDRNVSTQVQGFRQQEKTVTTHPPKQRPARYTRKQSITYPTNSLSAVASVPRLQLPSLFPFPSHSCLSRRKTKASNGGGGKKRSSSPALRRSCCMDSRKPMTMPFGGRERIAC
jgi:hypothetical protein